MAGLLSQTCFAQEQQIVDVEEEWLLEIGEPNADANAPQASMVMSPFADLSGEYFMFLLNHKTQPDYSAGGLQVQVWSGDDVEDYRDNSQDNEIVQTAEVVRWTQKLTNTGDGWVKMQITNGSSSTWGSFGDTWGLRNWIYTGSNNLNSYQPQISITESGIGYAGNRVASLTLQRITWTMSDGQQYEIHAPIDIDSDLDPWD
jgi:hypothetical protein